MTVDAVRAVEHGGYEIVAQVAAVAGGVRDVPNVAGDLRGEGGERVAKKVLRRRSPGAARGGQTGPVLRRPGIVDEGVEKVVKPVGGGAAVEHVRHRLDVVEHGALPKLSHALLPEPTGDAVHDEPVLHVRMRGMRREESSGVRVVGVSGAGVGGVVGAE